MSYRVAAVGLILLLSACQSISAAASPAQDVSSLQTFAEALASRYEQYNPSVPVPNLTLALAAKMTTAELVERLLGPDAISKIGAHELWEPILSGGPIRAITFFAHPRPIEEDICARSRFFVDLQPQSKSTTENARRDPPVIKIDVNAKTQIVLAPGCRLKPGAFFAGAYFLPPDMAASALRRLAALQKMARRGNRARISVTCESEFDPKACNPGAQTILARLPLDRIFSIGRLSSSEGQGFEFSVMPDGPGEGKTYWEVELDETPGKPPMLRLDWRLVAPF